MKKILLSALISFFFSFSSLFSQELYEVGFGQTNLVPENNEFVSLTLAGYAAPWEGRFTIQWKEIGKVPGYTGFTAIEDNLYITDGQNLLKSNEYYPYNFSVVGNANDIIQIAGKGKYIFGLTKNGQIKKSKISNKKLNWKNIGDVKQNISAIVQKGNQLILADKQGNFWRTNISGKIDIVQLNISSLKGTVALAVNHGALIALTGDGILYQQGGMYHQGKWMKIGYKNDITVKEEITDLSITNKNIYGIDKNGKIYKGEHRIKEGLSARALSIKNGKEEVVIVGLDLTGINDTYSAIIKDEIYKKTGLPASAVFLNSSHTHYAPVSQNWPTWQESNRLPDSLYLYDFIRKAIVDAVVESLNNKKPAELYFGRGKATLGFNRSLRQNPEIYDDAVDVIKFRYLSDNTEGYLFIAACHPVFGTTPEDRFALSSNFPGEARKLIKEGKGVSQTIFLQGTAGDINPLDNEEITGKKLADEILAVVSRPMDKISGPISLALDTIDFPTPLRSRESLTAFGNKPNETSEMIIVRDKTWSDIMLNNLDNGIKTISMPVYIHTVNIGNWKLVGFSRETTTPYGFQVKKMWPDKFVSVAGYTNDVSSYLPTKLHIDLQNYEGMGSFYWYGMPDTFPLDVEEKIISRIKKNNY